MRKIIKKLDVSPENSGLLFTMYFSFFVSGIMSIMIGVLLPYLKDDYMLNYEQSGMLLSAHQIGNLCAILLAGVLPYVVGRKASTLIMSSGLVIGLFMMTFTGNPLLLLVSFALLGISKGTMSNICNTTIGEVSGNKTAALNILHAVFAVGALLSPLIVFANTDLLTFGWKGSARMVAVLGILVWVLIIFSRLPGKLPAKEKAAKGSTKAVLKSKSFWLATGILFFYIGTEASIIGWFVTYFAEEGILSPTAAAFTPTMLWFMIMLGRIVCASISHKFNKSRLILCMGLIYSGLFIIMLISRNNVISVLCLLGIGFSMAGIYPTTLSTIKDLSSTAANGLCMGIATFGAILLPGLVGVVADVKGIAGGIATILSFCIGMVLIMIIKVIIDKSARQKES